MKLRSLLTLAALLLAAPFVRAQGDVVTIGPNQPKYVAPVELWTYASGAWVRGTGGNAAGAAATAVTPTISTVTTSGNVTAGSRSCTLIFSSNFAGTVLGATYAGGTDAAQAFVAPSGCTLSAIAYTITAGSIRIVDIR